MENTEESELSPILRALKFVDKKSTGEVRVHVANHRFEKDPTATALKLFDEFGMTRTSARNAVLVYLNRARRQFSIIADEGIHRAVGQKYWDGLAANFTEDLRSTHFENAVALLVFSVGTTMAKKFPRGN